MLSRSRSSLVLSDMRSFSFSTLTTSIRLVILTLLCSVIAVFAQEADSRLPGVSKTPDPDQPKNMREMQRKMQIDQEKKEYDEMLDRGQQALKISETLEKSFSENPALSRAELSKLDDLEKLVKKIRGELGGGDGDDSEADDPDPDDSPKSLADGFKSLQSLTTKLVDELKKTSRFGISALAIQSSNGVLKVVRFLKLSK